MNIILLIILCFCAFAIQYFLTFIQMRSFSNEYKALRRKGRVAIGKRKGAFSAGAIVLFAIDDGGDIIEAAYMQGVTVLARCKGLKGFNGLNVAALDEDICKERYLSRSMTAAVLNARDNYTTIMAGGEVAEPLSPLGRLTNRIDSIATGIKARLALK